MSTSVRARLPVLDRRETTPPVLDFERPAHRAALLAGALLRARYRERQDVRHKASDVDLVTTVDREAEALILDVLTREFPAHGIVAEESAPKTGTDPHRWYVDPLDGTTNFAHGVPHFAVSIALARGDDLILALVHDPIRQETFTGLHGKGARLNGSRIHVSDVPTLDRALLATGFPVDRRQNASQYVPFLQMALERGQCVRRGGSAALDLCYVASGRLDGFWEAKLRPWDTAAGRLIVEEAGGRVSDFSGGPHRLDGEETAASNDRIHGELLTLLRDAQAKSPKLKAPFPVT
jgi:myo-inositol-1(or 4)-monophosphatase